MYKKRHLEVWKIFRNFAELKSKETSTEATYNI